MRDKEPRSRQTSFNFRQHLLWDAIILWSNSKWSGNWDSCVNYHFGWHLPFTQGDNLQIGSLLSLSEDKVQLETNKSTNLVCWYQDAILSEWPSNSFQDRTHGDTNYVSPPYTAVTWYTFIRGSRANVCKYILQL